MGFSVYNYVNGQAVEGQLHALRECGVGGRVWQIVADVRQVRSLRRDAFDDVNGLRHCEMRRVRAVSQRIKDQHLDTLQ